MRASKTRPIAHAVAPFRLSAGIFFRAGIIILEKSLFYKKPKSLFRTRTKYVASSLVTMVRKGLVSFYKLRVLGHLGRKGLGAAISPTGVVFLEGGGRQTCALPKRRPPTLSLTRLEVKFSRKTLSFPGKT